MAMEESLNAVMKQKGKLPLNSTALRSLCVAKFPDDDGLVYECDLSHGHVWPWNMQDIFVLSKLVNMAVP